jgi:protoheme ferro-lyase
MSRITQHSKERIVQRDAGVATKAEAKKIGKRAFTSGQTINEFYKYPKFFNYLKNKKGQSNDCSIRVYRDNIYIWRGKAKSLVTAHPIPDRYIEEMREIDESN